MAIKYYSKASKVSMNNDWFELNQQDHFWMKARRRHVIRNIEGLNLEKKTYSRHWVWNRSDYRASCSGFKLSHRRC